jgi:hypothetical protein
MLLVTDHYRVHDAVALAAALAAQPDVSGDARQSWHRETRGGDGQLRSLVAINPGREADRIEVFCRTKRLADEGLARQCAGRVGGVAPDAGDHRPGRQPFARG